MIIKLGDLELDPNLILDDEFGYQPVAAKAETTIDGGLIVWTQQLSYGRRIDLVGRADSGWLTRTQVQTLYSMSLDPSATYQLIYGDQTYTVRFRWEDAPVLDMAMVVSRPNPDDDDYYYGRIKLMEV